MSKIPADLKYTKEHEWVRIEANDTLTVGLTDFAQQTLGDIVFVELPEVGRTLKEGGPAGVVESVKAATEIFAPVSGEVIAVNEEVGDEPEEINEDPYENWIFKMKLGAGASTDHLLTADAYAKLIG